MRLMNNQASSLIKKVKGDAAVMILQQEDGLIMKFSRIVLGFEQLLPQHKEYDDDDLDLEQK